MKSKKLRVVKEPENEIPVDIFEQAIVDISKGFKRLTNSRLSMRAIVILVQDAVGPARVTRGQVDLVLKAAADLERTYLKKAESR